MKIYAKYIVKTVYLRLLCKQKLKHIIMENMLLVTSIVIIAFGILQIILFFKIWGMTNDVRQIRKNIIGNSLDEAHKQIVLGNKDKAFEIYKRLYVEDLIKISELGDFEYGYPRLVEKYKYELSKLGDEYSIDFAKYDEINKIRKITE